ncbi:hypothetical protein [Fusobacterium sp. FSA-380-WT-2B]|uniref:hypothetical protein n=1 Tax=Fusobacterium sp. FSA-380-WT-2B TaxID=2605786 RepID=UPI0012B37DF4|nr:hypothetical protein [Fusobacterium sp. FSA-380-WT-2B]MSS62139.1 hypothetical protein [Fusobacterium sp. FSA-380-WT-2B]
MTICERIISIKKELSNIENKEKISLQIEINKLESIKKNKDIINLIRLIDNIEDYQELESLIKTFLKNKNYI